jgi:predicted RNase H-like HicB family nuclease
MKTLTLKNIIWKEGKYYVSQCLNVDVSSFGKTRKEALNNLREALDLYFDSADHPKVSKILEPKLVSTSFRHV